MTAELYEMQKLVAFMNCYIYSRERPVLIDIFMGQVFCLNIYSFYLHSFWLGFLHSAVCAWLHAMCMYVCVCVRESFGLRWCECGHSFLDDDAIALAAFAALWILVVLPPQRFLRRL